MNTKMLLVQEVENGTVKTVYFGPSQSVTPTDNAQAKRSAAMKRAWKTRKASATKTK